MKKFKESKLFKILQGIKTVITWVFLIVAVTLTITIFISRLTGVPPSVMGYSFLRVSTGSMQPTLRVGDMILVKSCTADELNKGDIVTYKSTQGDMAGQLVTHRVVKELYQENGSDLIVTRGDANFQDDSPVSSTQIVGKMERKLPIFTQIFNFFLTPWGLLIVILLILLAFSGEIINIIKALTKTDEVKSDKKSMEEIIEKIKQQENKEN